VKLYKTYVKQVAGMTIWYIKVGVKIRRFGDKGCVLNQNETCSNASEKNLT